VWVNAEEIEAIAAFLNEPIDQFVQLHTRLIDGECSLREKANCDCVCYDKSVGCTIYEVRPAQCRTWPYWESNLRTPADWQHTCEICPGSGKGELIPVEEITRRLNVIRL
jgi:Fe-S-cluster containining protein